MKKLLYIGENREIMPQNAFLLSKDCLPETEFLKKQNIFFWEGTLDTLVSVSSKDDVKKGLDILELLLQGNVVLWEENRWKHYTCNVVMMYCCAGPYLKIVNKKILI